MARTWQRHGRDMAKTWQCHGRDMAKPCQSHGKHMARTWRRHGKYMANRWRTYAKDMANTWQRHGKDMAKTWQSMFLRYDRRSLILCSLPPAASDRSFGAGAPHEGHVPPDGLRATMSRGARSALAKTPVDGRSSSSLSTLRAGGREQQSAEDLRSTPHRARKVRGGRSTLIRTWRAKGVLTLRPTLTHPSLPPPPGCRRWLIDPSASSTTPSKAGQKASDTPTAAGARCESSRPQRCPQKAP